MDKHLPPAGSVASRMGVRFASGPNSSFDLFAPAERAVPLPVVVWVHGGAWISGSSVDVDPYLRILAAKGYATVGLNYTPGPEATYPTAVTQLNDALKYISEHAAELGVDAHRVVLAGDSAGAQLASQLATIITNPQYAHLMGIQPAINPASLIGTILHCGVYDMDALADLGGIDAWGFRVALWAYTGTKDWSQTFVGSTMSTINYVTPQYPPTFITGGNGDGLTWIESIPMASALKAHNVPVQELFWPANHTPALQHEYQFNLDRPEAKQALSETLDFLAAIAKR
ncbi:alpha/beta hydrolase [Leifsonia sp. NPDC102414]|uniref:alpha/beta hydrolase n=1 Tax=Leifsonia sp. NPDC102414 TaxID=3364124 RepID=UPI003812869F